MVFVVLNEQGIRRSLPRPIVLADEALNSNDKSLDLSAVYPLAAGLDVHNIRIALTTTGTAGSRDIGIEVRQGATVVRALEGDFNEGANGQENWEYSIGAVPTAGPADVTREYLPAGFFILAGQTLRVFDRALVDANDDMLIYVTGVLWLK